MATYISHRVHCTTVRKTQCARGEAHSTSLFAATGSNIGVNNKIVIKTNPGKLKKAGAKHSKQVHCRHVHEAYTRSMLGYSTPSSQHRITYRPVKIKYVQPLANLKAVQGDGSPPFKCRLMLKLPGVRPSDPSSTATNHNAAACHKVEKRGNDDCARCLHPQDTRTKRGCKMCSTSYRDRDQSHRDWCLIFSAHLCNQKVFQILLQ
jgi:hypothetical protein